MQTAPSGSIVQLELPQQYNSDDLNSFINYSHNVLDGYCPSTCANVSVTYSGFVFNISGLWPTTDQMAFKYTIIGIPNPRVSKLVNGYSLRILNPSLAVIYQDIVPAKTFLPKTMSCSGTITDFTAIGFLSTAYLTINPISNPRD